MNSHQSVRHPNELLKKDTFNRRLAKKLGSILGNMYFFYFCVVLDIAEFPSVISHPAPIVLISYVSQTVIQLLALPVLQVYQNLIQENSDAKSEVDHVALTHIANVVDEIRANQT